MYQINFIEKINKKNKIKKNKGGVNMSSKEKIRSIYRSFKEALKRYADYTVYQGGVYPILPLV